MRRLPVIPLIVAVGCLAAIGFTILHSSGYTGATLRTGGSGCVCHGDHVPTDSVLVWISGPDSVRLGHAALYAIFMKGGPAVKGGYNAAVGLGSIQPADSTSQLISGELTHSAPKSFSNDTVRWNFLYQAPASGTTDTLYGVGNSVDGNGNPTNDMFNFSPNVLVHLIDTTTGVDDSREPGAAGLLQNFPNPFNPSTTVRFRLARPGEAIVDVVDAGGRKVTVLHKGWTGTEPQTVQWNASGFGSGIYFLRLTSAGTRLVRKMMILK